MLCDTGISANHGIASTGPTIRPGCNIVRVSPVHPHSARLQASLRLSPVSLRSTIVCILYSPFLLLLRHLPPIHLYIRGDLSTCEDLLFYPSTVLLDVLYAHFDPVASFTTLHVISVTQY